MGVLVDYAHLSNDCAAKAAFTHTAIKEKKKIPGASFDGTIAFRFQDELSHKWKLLCVSLVVFFFFFYTSAILIIK